MQPPGEKPYKCDLLCSHPVSMLFLVASYATLHPPMWTCWLLGQLVRPFWAAAPKGSMTYAFTHMGNFLLLLLLLRTPLPPASRPISHPGGPYPSLEGQIPVLRPKSLETGIWASRLEFEGEGRKRRRRRTRRKFPICVKA